MISGTASMGMGAEMLSVRKGLRAAGEGLSGAGDLDAGLELFGGGFFTSLVRPRGLAFRLRTWFGWALWAEASLSLRQCPLALALGPLKAV